MKWNGRKVLTAEEWDYSEAKIGDLVEQELVDDMLDLLPPACMQPDCSQMGEAYSHRQDPDTGKWRPTFHTFKKSRRQMAKWDFRVLREMLLRRECRAWGIPVSWLKEGLDGEQEWPFIHRNGTLSSLWERGRNALDYRCGRI